MLLEGPDSTGADWILGTVPTEPDMGSLVRLASVMCPISDTPVVLALGRPRSPIGVMLTPFIEPLCCQNFPRLLGGSWLGVGCICIQ